jgi:CCR4-NOT complex subunit CAF16
VSKMVHSIRGVSEERKKKLVEVLDVDLDWRMHQVSDGQRRRVQLLLGLLHPFKVSYSCRAPGLDSGAEAG